MCWYKKIKSKQILTTLVYAGVVSSFVSCEISSENTNNKELYFNIPSYFEKQVNELTKSNPLVLKKVYNKDGDEEKEIHISNWNTELSSFLSIDLNKPAYAGYIVKDSIDNVVTYTFTNKELDINSVKVVYQNNTAMQIEIDKTTKNFLYQTNENLVYIQDSLYSVEKLQKVILTNPNSYKITGLIK